MSDLTVVLDRKNMAVRLEPGVLVVDQPACAPSKIPLNMIANVIVIGSPMVSCGVWRALAERKIPSVILPARGRGEPAFIGRSLSGMVVRRLDQYRAALDMGNRLNIGMALLQKKLRGQEINLAALERKEGELEVHIEKIYQFRNQLGKAETESSLMGLEGMAAHHYFSGMKEIFFEKWGFSGRNRRPPRDPINSLLSLSYVLAGSEVRKIVFEKGMDPALGFLHSAKNGRESFVLDLLEPVRPHVDGFVFQLLAGPMRRNYFSINETEGCLLNKAGRKIFFQWWGTWTARDSETPTIKDIAGEALNEILAMAPFKTDDERPPLLSDGEEPAPDWM